MTNFQNRFYKYYSERGIDCFLEHNNLWVSYKKMIMPVAPVSFPVETDARIIKHLHRQFPEAILIRTTIPSANSSNDNSFHAVVCKEFIHIDFLPAKKRYDIRKGLKNFEVFRIESTQIVQNGYPVYIKALTNYKSKLNSILSEEKFKETHKISENFQDIIHYWGIFHKSQLIGFAMNFIYNKTEANYTMVKIDPEFQKLYPSYALFYTMNSYYLAEQGFEYTNDGFVSLSKHSNIQEYLITKFGFQKFPLNLEIHYKIPYNLLMKMFIPFRTVLHKTFPAFEPLFVLDSFKSKNLKNQ